METLELIAKAAFVFVVWLALSSPFAFGVFKAIKWLRVSNRQSLGVCVCVAVIATLLIAPMPTPIITIFIPSALAWATGTMQQYLVPSYGWTTQAISMALASYSITLAVAFFVCKRLICKIEGPTMVGNSV